MSSQTIDVDQEPPCCRSRLCDGQQCIVAAGETREELEASPFAEQLLDKGYEVIYFTDPVDEYVMQNLLEYEDFKFQSASKEDLKLGDKDAKKENKKLRVCPAGVIQCHKCTFLVMCV